MKNENKRFDDLKAPDGTYMGGINPSAERQFQIKSHLNIAGQYDNIAVEMFDEGVLGCTDWHYEAVLERKKISVMNPLNTAEIDLLTQNKLS